MAEKILNSRLINKHDTETNWLKADNFIPKQGEMIVYDVDSIYDYERIKIGDGKTTVSNLPFVCDALKETFDERIGTVETKVDTVSSLVGDVAVSEQIAAGITSFVHASVKLKDSATGYSYMIEMINGQLVSSCCCKNLNIAALPTKTTYAEGEEFDPSGMVVVAVCEDGSTKTIKNYTTSCDMTVGENTVVVSYSENDAVYTCTFVIKVLSIEDTLIDFDYTNNGDGTYTITGWKETLNGEPSTECIIPDSDKIKL